MGKQSASNEAQSGQLSITEFFDSKLPTHARTIYYAIAIIIASGTGLSWWATSATEVVGGHSINEWVDSHGLNIKRYELYNRGPWGSQPQSLTFIIDANGETPEFLHDKPHLEPCERATSNGSIICKFDYCRKGEKHILHPKVSVGVTVISTKKDWSPERVTMKLQDGTDVDIEYSNNAIASSFIEKDLKPLIPVWFVIAFLVLLFVLMLVLVNVLNASWRERMRKRISDEETNKDLRHHPPVPAPTDQPLIDERNHPTNASGASGDDEPGVS